MPLTKSGEKIKRDMVARYGEKKGASVFYASINAGKKGTEQWHQKSKEKKLKRYK